MIDFTYTQADKEILGLAHEQAKIARKYVRYYDKNEFEICPANLPEANEEPDVRAMLDERKDETSGYDLINSLIYHEEGWGNIPLRSARLPLGSMILEMIGTKEQQDRYRGLYMAIGLTEPGAGSDPASIRTTAKWDEAAKEWVINGEKIFVTGLLRGHGAVILARTSGPDEPAKFQTFIIEKTMEGVHLSRKARKMGTRADDTASSMILDNVRLSEDYYVGGDFRSAMSVLNETRGVVGGIALGYARAALEETKGHLDKAGIEIEYGGSMQGMSAAADRFIRMEALFEAGILTVIRTKWLETRDGPSKIPAAIAKAIGARATRKILQECLEIVGPAALSEDGLLEKWFRDVRIYDIYEGAGEIQRLILARDLLGYSSKELS